MIIILGLIGVIMGLAGCVIIAKWVGIVIIATANHYTRDNEVYPEIESKTDKLKINN